MGMFDKAKDMADSAKNLVEDNADKVKGAVSEHGDKLPGDLGSKAEDAVEGAEDLTEKLPGQE